MAIVKTISQFKSQLSGGGARNNLFEVSLGAVDKVPGVTNWPGDKFKFLCKAAALPASIINPIDVPFRGRTLKVAGDRTIEPWTITVINDEKFDIRTALEQWVNAMSKLENNTGITDPSSYMRDATVTQLGRGITANSTALGSPNVVQLRTYTFKDIFPTNVAPIDLSYDTENAIEEYTVEFQVNYWEAGGSNSDTDIRIT